MLARIAALVVAALYCLSPTSTQSQCTGQFAAGAICQNPAAAQGLPRAYVGINEANTNSFLINYPTNPTTATTNRITGRTFMGAASLNDNTFYASGCPGTTCLNGFSNLDWLSALSVTPINGGAAIFSDVNYSQVVILYDPDNTVATSVGTPQVALTVGVQGKGQMLGATPRALSFSAINNSVQANDIWGQYGECHAISATASHTWCAEWDARNANTAVTWTPYSHPQPGIVLHSMACGAGLLDTGQTNCTASHFIGSNSLNSMGGVGAVRLQAGIIFASDGIAASGPSFLIPAVQLPEDYALVWYKAASTLSSAIRGDATGNFQVILSGGVLETIGGGILVTSGNITTTAGSMVVPDTFGYVWGDGSTFIGGSSATDAITFNTGNGGGGSGVERARFKSTGVLNYAGLTSDPSGAEGDFYYNSTNHIFRWYNGTAWGNIGNVSAAATLTSGSLVIGQGTQSIAVTTTGTGVVTALGNNTNSAGGFVTSPVANANLANSSTTVNGQTCTLGSSCTVTAVASQITVGTTLVGSGSSGNVLYNNAGILGEYTTIGSGTVVVKQTSPTFVTDITTPIAKLSGTSNQLVFQSGGVTGTISWTPSSGNKTISLPNGSTDFTLTGPGVLQQASGGAPLTVTTVNLASTNFVTGTLPVANGGTNCSAASITCFNNITNFTAAGTTGTTSTNLVFSTSPSLTTPVLGVATGTSLALGGCTIGSNAICGTGDLLMSGNITTTGGQLFIANGNSFTWGDGSTSIGGDAASDIITFNAGSAERARVNTSGFVLATAASDATHTDATVCRDTTSGLLLAGSGTLGVCLGTSGRQFKDIIREMREGLAEIMKVKFWDYRYLPGYGDGGARLQRGPTAQDVEEIIPDIVGHDANGVAINYDVGALLIIGLKAIQELAANDNQRRADNDNIRQELEQLKRFAR